MGLSWCLYTDELVCMLATEVKSTSRVTLNFKVGGWRGLKWST
ncbi:rCG60561 [Rattus norvegicus]|uniref:RCG60561 n=1 Tax=Rattus norvegicus TaxID=10116 RepID=A6JL01_RAT|nr:rCG60561 [Rattus norvegicus]